MKSITYLTTTIFLLGLTVTNASAERGVTVLDQGMDDTIRYYSVVCPTNKQTTLTYDVETKDVCVYPVGSDKEAICKTTWERDDAAKEACK